MGWRTFSIPVGGLTRYRRRRCGRQADDGRAVPPVGAASPGTPAVLLRRRRATHFVTNMPRMRRPKARTIPNCYGTQGQGCGRHVNQTGHVRVFLSETSQEAMPGPRRVSREELMIGGEAEATQIPVRCSSFDGSRRGDFIYGLARRGAGRWRAATAAMSQPGRPLGVQATTGWEGRDAAWISR